MTTKLPVRTGKYLCVVDFEATCWGDGNAGKRDEMEIIEFGAVLADASTLEKLSEFQTFVRPVRNPLLTDFCRGLTSIRQEDVDRAPMFPEASQMFMTWLGDGRAREEATFASWGHYDFAQLERDCAYHKVQWPFFLKDHVNLKNVVAERMGWRPKGVAKALSAIGFRFEGTAHRGIDDARNILRIARKAFP